MNSDELLVQLDFDETNVNSHLQQQQHQEQQQQQQQINSIESTSEPILSTGELLLPHIDKPADVLKSHYHRRSFSDDNALATVSQSIQQLYQSHSNIKTKPTENLSLINLSRSHSSVDENLIGHLEPTTHVTSSIVLNGDGVNQIHHTDDTIEVSLLADLSMDSRESQPLLGIGRDAHDFVYNNFPGKELFPIRWNSFESL